MEAGMFDKQRFNLTSISGSWTGDYGPINSYKQEQAGPAYCTYPLVAKPAAAYLLCPAFLLIAFIGWTQHCALGLLVIHATDKTLSIAHAPVGVRLCYRDLSFLAWGQLNETFGRRKFKPRRWLDVTDTIISVMRSNN